MQSLKKAAGRQLNKLQKLIFSHPAIRVKIELRLCFGVWVWGRGHSIARFAAVGPGCKTPAATPTAIACGRLPCAASPSDT